MSTRRVYVIIRHVDRYTHCFWVLNNVDLSNSSIVLFIILFIEHKDRSSLHAVRF